MGHRHTQREGHGEEGWEASPRKPRREAAAEIHILTAVWISDFW